MRHDPERLVGYRALGRFGELGVVVDADEDSTRAPAIVIRGGISSGLLFIVPHERIDSIERGRHVVQLDVDLADFVPSLLEDGTVQLLLDSELVD